MVDFANDTANSAAKYAAQVKLSGKIGVKTESLTAPQTGLLSIYDTGKAVNRGMLMTNIRLLEKRCERSGD